MAKRPLRVTMPLSLSIEELIWHRFLVGSELQALILALSLRREGSAVHDAVVGSRIRPHVPLDLSAVEAAHFPDEQRQHLGDIKQALEAQSTRIARHLRAGNADFGHGAAAAQQFGEDLALEGESGAVDAQLPEQIDAVHGKAIVVLDLLSEQEVQQVSV